MEIGAQIGTKRFISTGHCISLYFLESGHELEI